MLQEADSDYNMVSRGLSCIILTPVQVPYEVMVDHVLFHNQYPFLTQQPAFSIVHRSWQQVNKSPGGLLCPRRRQASQAQPNRLFKFALPTHSSSTTNPPPTFYVSGHHQTFSEMLFSSIARDVLHP